MMNSNSGKGTVAERKMTDARHLLVISSFWPTRSNEISGIFVAQQAAAFAKLGYYVDICIPAGYRLAHRLLSPSDLDLDTHRIDVNYVRAPLIPARTVRAQQFNAISVGKQLRKRLTRTTSKANYFGCIIHGLPAALSAPGWRDTIDGPLLAVVHGVNPGLSPNGSAGRAKLIQSSMDDIHRIVLVGSQLRRYARQLGLPPGKTIVVPNGTDIPIPPVIPSLQSQSNVKTVILSVANLTRIKGIDHVLHALASINRDDFEYRVVGDGPEKEKLEALAIELGIAHQVSFLGRLGYSATMEQMGQCDVFCLPSWREAFGIVYLEAMIRAKPAIGCFGNGPQDFITDGVDGLLIPPKRPDILAAILERLLEEPKLRQMLGNNARLIAEEYTWKANAERMVALLTDN